MNPNMLTRLLAILLLSLTGACGDATQPATSDDADSTSPSAALDTDQVTDIVDQENEDLAPPVPEARNWSHRAIGGVSMGAAAVNLALANPGTFDLVGGLGGYANLRYMLTTAQRLHLAGFCPLETLVDQAEHLNNPEADPPIFCGPGLALEELEYSQDFNHLHYATNGATCDRGFYREMFQSLTMAFGNFTSEPSGTSTFLPAGVNDDWFQSTPRDQRCKDGYTIAQGMSYNAEYNPTGSYPVIPFCDSDNRSPGLAKSGDFDPTVDHTTPFDIALAVDINANGRRDYGEPLFLNPWERFDDVGADGCPNHREDGQGGCLPSDAADATETDPNRDDFHWWDQPLGSEANSWRDAGEPYRDDGCDGVANTGDRGEGNGQYDTVSAFDRLNQLSAPQRILEASAETLASMDFYLDAGLRDALHAQVATRHIIGALKARTADAAVYYGLAGRPGALLPAMDEDEVLQKVFDANLSSEAIGKHVYVEYGDPDASEDAIAEGEGAHVGTITQAINRIILLLAWSITRFPDPDVEPNLAANPQFSEYHSFYSEGLKSRRGYVITMPPGYYQDGREELRYPVVYLLHGLGQDAASLAPAGIATAGLMTDGVLPKAIIVYPDGDCCRVHKETGERECACRRVDDVMSCIDPTCTGPEESCATREIAPNQLTEECNGGSLYFNLLTNRWGEPRDDLGYADSVMELVEHVDTVYRTRSGQPSTSR